MNLETILKFHNDLTRFDSSYPILVSYDRTNGLVYRQLNQLMGCHYFGNYFFPSTVKYGLLLPKDYHELMQSLEKLIQEPGLNTGDLNTNLKKFGFEVFKLVPGTIGPQLVYDIKLTSITNSFISKIILRYYNLESRTLYNIIKNENRKRKSSKSVA